MGEGGKKERNGPYLGGVDFLDEFVDFGLLTFSEFFDFPCEFEASHGIHVRFFSLVSLALNLHSQTIQSRQRFRAQQITFG